MQIQWEDADFSIAREGYADSLISVSALARRATPMSYGEHDVQRLMMLYVYDADMDKKKARRLLERMFKSDDLAVASRVIRFVGYATKDLPKSMKEEYGQAEPAFIFLDGDGVEMERVDGVVQAGSLVRKLNKLYRTQHEGTLTELYKRTKSVLEEIDDANKYMVGLEDKARRARADFENKATRGNEAASKKADAELADAQADLAELIAERDALAQPKLSKERLEQLAQAGR